MVRAKDENKRLLILKTAKMLFSRSGFFNTSIADIVKETGLPIGSIYTYFKSKEEIISTIVEEGWQELSIRLSGLIASASSPRKKLQIIIEKFVPELLSEGDFINILLTEALPITRIEEKMEKVTSMVFKLLEQVGSQKDFLRQFPKIKRETTLVIYFLGILYAAKLSRSSSIGIRTSDIMEFIRQTAEKSVGIKL